MKIPGKLLFALAGGILFIAGCRHSPEPCRQALQPGEAVYFIPNNKKMIALTFDDGPNGKFTEQILDALREHKVPATFFLIGANVERFPETVKRMGVEGHSIGNHTYRHSRFDQVSREEMAGDITEGGKTIEKVTGKKPLWFRPPYGINGTGMTEICRAQGIVAAGWSLDANDWNPHPVEELVDAIARQATAGDIILLHDGWETRSDADRHATVAAVPAIIDRLKAAGFVFVTLPELLRNAGAPAAQFENGIRLLGLQFGSKPVAPRHHLEARYFWDVPEICASNLPRAFVHITLAGGKFLFQNDHPLQPPGDLRDRVVREAIAVPANAPTGRYEVSFGLFYKDKPDIKDRLEVRSEFPQRDNAVRAPFAVEIKPAAGH